MIIPVGASVVGIIVASALGWWRPILRDDRPVRRWVWIVPIVMLVAILSGRGSPAGSVGQRLRAATEHNPVQLRRIDGHALAMVRGVVKFFKADKGWGAITSDELPGGTDAWVHFTVIEAPANAYRTLAAGDIVEFDFEVVQQDSFGCRATRARVLAAGPAPTLRRAGDRVVIVPDGTPDTPLLPRKVHRAEGRD